MFNSRPAAISQAPSNHSGSTQRREPNLCKIMHHAECLSCVRRCSASLPVWSSAGWTRVMMNSKAVEGCWSRWGPLFSRETRGCPRTLRSSSGEGEPGSLAEQALGFESGVASCVLQAYCVLGLGAVSQATSLCSGAGVWSCFAPRGGKPLLETHSEGGRGWQREGFGAG